MTGTASVFSLVQDDHARAESEAWAHFVASASETAFHASWLGILCTQVDHVQGALLLLRAEDGVGYAPVAVWPDPSRPMQHLGPAAEKTLRSRSGTVVGPDGISAPLKGQPAFVGYPIEVNGALHGAVVLQLGVADDKELQRALRQVHWAIGWMLDRFRQQLLADESQARWRLGLITELMALALDEPRFASAVLAVVNALAARLDCDRVALGVDRAGAVEVLAVSHTATFDARTNMVRLLGEAMDEVLDLDLPLVYPSGDGDEFGVLAHAQLARECRDTAICSVPLLDNGHAFGVLTLERTSGKLFDPPTVDLCRTLGQALGPLLALKQEAERGVWARMHGQGRDALQVLFGPRQPGIKLVAAATAMLLLFVGLVTGEYRVSARTVIEGAVQRAAVAPFEGYLLDSRVRAGDTVRQGQVLARIDDKDLLLEQARWSAERAQLQSKYRQAFSAQDRASMQQLLAQTGQAQAQLNLVESKLVRSVLRAPYDGIVVSGDLSQLLGTPLELGKVLFEIAPLDAYRIILQVDERDMADLRMGQRGELVLSGLPGQPLPFSVKQITPVTSAKDGANHFRVEAQVDPQAFDRLRPGMEGVGKVSVGERRLIWIWTHSLIDWLRLTLWKWLP